jgi:hypothetical protein
MVQRFSLLILFLLVLVTPLRAFSAPTAYVDKTASGVNDGTSWENAYTDLQQALSAVVSGEIWGAAGSYEPGATRADTFQLKNNVALYGGFDGTEDTLDQRDPSIHQTILNGDLLGDDYSRFVNGHAVWSDVGDNTVAQ